MRTDQATGKGREARYRLLLLFCASVVLGRSEGQSRNTASTIEASCELLRRDVIQYAEGGRLREAEMRLLEGVSDMERKELGVECVGIVLNKLAIALQRSQRLADAEIFAERFLRKLEANHQPADRILFHPLHLLAGVYLRRGEVGRARSMVRRLQAIRTAWLEEEALVGGIRAALSQAEGHSAEAEHEYLATLGLWAKAGLGNNLASSEILNRLAFLYAQTGRFPEAKNAFQRAQTMLDSQPDATETDRMSIQNNLAILHYRQREYAQAEDYFRRAIALAERLPQMDSGALKTILANYAVLLRKTDRKHEAKLVEARAKTIHAKDEKGARSIVVDASELWTQNQW